jgi:hypothetical protein
MAQDVKSFEFEVLGFKNLEFEGFNILGPCPWMVKASIWMFLDSQTSKPGGHPKSKLLASRGMAPGC